MDIKDEIIESIDRLNPELFNQLKDLLIPAHLVFYTYKTQGEIDKHVFEEKLFSYFALIEEFNKKKDFPVSFFSDELFPLINVREDKKLNRTVILKYVQKASVLKKKISLGNYSFDDLRDFARIFLSLYLPYQTSGKQFQDDDFSFEIKGRNYRNVYYQLGAEKKAKDLYSGFSFAIVVLTILYFDIMNSLREVD